MKGVSQLNKWARDLKWRGRECIYTPHSQSQSLSANSTFFILTGRAGRYERTRPVGGNGRFENQGRWVTGRAYESDQRWPDASDRSKPSLEPLCTLTGLGHSGVRSDKLSVWLLTLALLTVGRAICASGQASQSIRSMMLLLLLSTALTGCVRSRQRPHPVKEKWLKLLWIVMQLEPSFLQIIFGLHLSCLVLSLTSVHHT
jgi:hypothetical protein